MMTPARFLPFLIALLGAACATTEGVYDNAEQAADEAESAVYGLASLPEAPDSAAAELGEEGEVSLAIAESEPEADPDVLDEVLVLARPRGEVIRNLVAEARAMLRDTELEYFFTGKGKNELLRGRPVVFALWSENRQEWTIAHVEIPRPPIRWRPGGRPMKFLTRTPGIKAEHVKGTGAERLMFAFSKDGEPLRVYGRKFPVFDSSLIRKRNWRGVAATAQPIVYLPFTEDTFDPLFIRGGREYLLSTARKAIEELRAANAPSVAYPGEALADVVPAEVLAALAVIEQTDDTDYIKKPDAFNEVLNQYGLKREEAYRYSVSVAAAIGPMQFTNRRGNGTYAMVVRRCREARIDPDFERGATNMLNAMKAAICLFDIELSQMKPDIRRAYHDNRKVLGIFPVAAYNGGPRNVARLSRVLNNMKVNITDLREPGEQPAQKPVLCPCVWKQAGDAVVPVSIPRYNNENRWYIEKYQNILRVFE